MALVGGDILAEGQGGGALAPDNALPLLNH